MHVSGHPALAEGNFDTRRSETVSPSSLREAFQLISAADKVLSNVSKMGKELLGDLNGPGEGKGTKAPPDPGEDS